VKGASFSHAGVHAAGGHLHLVSSFHPSRLNVNTGRLTSPMLDEVFSLSRKLLA
jgi:uracil-DNA glycosylase